MAQESTLPQFPPLKRPELYYPLQRLTLLLPSKPQNPQPRQDPAQTTHLNPTLPLPSVLGVLLPPLISGALISLLGVVGRERDLPFLDGVPATLLARPRRCRIISMASSRVRVPGLNGSASVQSARGMVVVVVIVRKSVGVWWRGLVEGSGVGGDCCGFGSTSSRSTSIGVACAP